MGLSIHRHMRSTLLLAKFCGLLPVKGLMAADSTRLRFQWCSLSVLYWLVVWMGQLYTLQRTWTTVRFREPNGSLSAISNSTLMRCAIPPLVVYPLFLHLSIKWPHFVHTWETIEGRLMVGRTNHRLHYKIIFLTVIFAAMRLAFFTSGYIVTAIRVIQCVDLRSVSDFIHTLFYVRFPQVYSITPPAFWKHILLMFLELTSTWAWLAVHLLVLDLSLLLSDSFRTFNYHLDRWRGKAATSKFWREMRSEFCRLSLLCDVTDSLLSPMVFASVILETVNVTLFIYLGLTHAYTVLSYLYFAIFFSSHLGVDGYCLVAMASVLDESRKPFRALQLVPTDGFCLEARRLYTQVRRETAALTGCRFFVVSQTTILSIMSALVTYEVLLVQLGSLKHEELAANESGANSTLEYCAWISNYLQTK